MVSVLSIPSSYCVNVISGCGVPGLIKYFIRGLAIAIIVYWLFKQLTPYPAISIVILSGLIYSIPFPSPRHMFYSTVILLSIGSIHYVHTVFLRFYNAFLEFLVVVSIWSLVLWVNVRGRWESLVERHGQ